MAQIDDLINQVEDPRLRQELGLAAQSLRKKKKFGLVYEEHVPETVLLGSQVGVKAGMQVRLRREPKNNTRYTVETIDSTLATIFDLGGGEKREVAIKDLLVVTPFGTPVYPVLVQNSESVVRSENKGFHTVINGENFHALQLLLYAYEGLVDCIYIDPPYNTGAKDWKYNNNYVDDNDTYQHSKWLAFMEKRLRLAKRLLKPSGVLVVTIDEHELFNLGVLLHQIFKEYLLYPISIVINSRGSTGTRNFGVIDEYALFVVPNTGTDLITPREAYITGLGTLAQDAEDPTEDPEEDMAPQGYWTTAYRTGQGTSFRYQRPKQFYPIYLDSTTKLPIGTGAPLLSKIPKGPLPPPPTTHPRGKIAIWPIDTDGAERVWAFEPSRMREEILKGNLRVGKFNEVRGTWPLSVRRFRKTDDETTRFRERTIWWEKSYDAGANGSSLVKRLLGESGRFPFPKSVYAVRDTLSTVVGNNPNAVVLDFFAGSGTTLHALALLNAVDNGQRRGIVVTNNEVGEDAEKKLNSEGLFRGDSDFEAKGICKSATEPRIRAAFTGTRPDGNPVKGVYKWAEKRQCAEGFDENAVFFDLSYVNADVVESGSHLKNILPVLWLASGAKGNPETLCCDANWFLDPKYNFAVLLNEDRFVSFKERLGKLLGISHIWIVTDSDAAFARMVSQLPSYLVVGMLYKDYMRNFEINTEAKS